MKKVVLLFAALLVAGCGEKRSPEGSDSTGESAEPSADAAKHPPAESPVAESPSEEPSSDTPKTLSDADVERNEKEETKITTRLDEETIVPLMIKSIIDPLIPKP